MSHLDVHAASGRRLGASEPRQEGPVDLRLVPPAMAAWAGAALALSAPGRWTTTSVVLCVGAAMVLLAMSGASATHALRRGPAGTTPHRPSAGAGGVAAEGEDEGESGAAVRGRRRPRATATATAAALLCAAAGAASAGLHSADVRQGPVHLLAQRFARVEAEVTVTSDARRTLPRVRGDHSTPASLLVDAEITRLAGPDGAVTRLSTPVLLIVSPGGSMGSGSSCCPPRTCVSVADWRHHCTTGSAMPPYCDPRARARLTSSGLLPSSSARQARCEAVCDRRPSGSNPMRGPFCRAWWSATPRGSLPNCTRRSRPPISPI